MLEDGAATAEILRYGYPSPEMCVMARPYLEELFYAVGVEKVEVEERACRCMGDPACSYNIRWESVGD